MAPFGLSALQNLRRGGRKPWQAPPASWERPELFRWLQEKGEVPEVDLWHTFNLGVGYCLVLPEAAVAQALQVCADQGHQAWRLGVVEPGAADAAATLVGLPT
jgi:phosphoribosylformylglycinamidine cyclo-ligase